MSILLILDFDNTLGDTYGPYGEGNIFKNKVLEDTEQAESIYSAHRRGPDDIIMYQRLLDAYGIDDAGLFFRSSGLGKQLYSDVKPFLLKMQADPEVITTILTTGDEDFQRLKTRITGVDELVDEVYTTRDRDKISHIKNLVEKHQPDATIFIDDRIHMCKADFDFPIRIFEMNREKKKVNDNILYSLDEIDIHSLYE